MTAICVDRYEAFSTAGNASKIKPISLDDMHVKYLSGELEQQIK